MAKFKKIKARWMTEAQMKAFDLGIKTDPDEFRYKEIFVNLDNIATIEEQEGYCVLNFSMQSDDGIVTDIPYNQVDELIKEIEG